MSDKYPDAKSKVDKMKEVGLCLKCAGSSHRSAECHYKFRRPCHVCNKPNHFSYLCFKNMKDVKAVANGVCAVNYQSCSLLSNKSSSNLLPTFSCQIGKNSTLRILADSGAQTSFIAANVAKFC